MSVISANDQQAPFPRAILVAGMITLTVFSILPAFRVQIFGSHYDSYYLVRVSLFFTLVLMFWAAGDRFSRSLAIGDTSPVDTGYGDPLLTLRAMACAIVLVGHGASISFVPADIVHQASHSRAFWLLLPMPWAGVWIFFTLSGYLMGKVFFNGRYTLSREGLSRFYRNRFVRVAPLVYFSIALIVLFERPEALLLSNLKHLVALLSFDFDMTSPLSFFGPLWSIATEMQFYLIAPFVAVAISWVAPRIGILSVFAAFLLFGLAYRLGFFYLSRPIPWTTSVYTPLVGNIDLFGMGVATSYLIQRHHLKWSRLGYAIVIMTLTWIGSTLAWCHYISDVTAVHAFLRFVAPSLFGMATVSAIVVIENAVRTGVPPSWPVQAFVRSTQLLGALSFAIYIWHGPIFTAYAKILTRPITSKDTVVALIVASSLVLAFSWLTYILVEKPADQMKISRSPQPHNA